MYWWNQWDVHELRPTRNAVLSRSNPGGTLEILLAENYESPAKRPLLIAQAGLAH
jgi:hypothetical protein